MRDGIGLNNLTIVGNQAGILFDAPLGKGYLANSIILGNPYPGGQQTNCAFAENDQSILQNNLVSQECGLGATHYPNEYWSGTQLIAERPYRAHARVCRRTLIACYVPIVSLKIHFGIFSSPYPAKL